MPAELRVDLALLTGFLVVLARLSLLFVLAPLPALHQGSLTARLTLAVAVSVVLFPLWPRVATPLTLSELLGLLLPEVTLGLTLALATACILEAFSVAGQLLALQAGYAYAVTIDPTSEADAGVLPTLLHLGAALVALSLGLDARLFRALARSLETIPPGAYLLTPPTGEAIIQLLSLIFSVALSFALPLIGLLLLLDLALALMGRLSPQLQLLALAFPAKMAVALWMLVLLASLLGQVCARTIDHVWPSLLRLIELRV